MANLIQIKRSFTSAAPGSLSAGELAFSNATGGSGVLFVGSTDGGTVVPIGGIRTPGVLTANQALVTNSLSLIDTIKIGSDIANVVVTASGITLSNTDGEGNTITISTPNNTEKAGSYYLKADGSWSTVTGATADPAGSNTHIQYNDSGAMGGSAAFTFDESTNSVFIANAALIGGNANAANFTTTGTVNTGTVYATSTVNAVSYNTGGGFGSATGGAIVNTTVIAVGNSSVNATMNSTFFTGTANNADYLGGVAAGDYQTEAGLAANVATLTSNNSNYLGGVIAASYVQNTDSRTLSGNLTFSGANVTFTGANLTVTGTNTYITSNTNLAGTTTTISSNLSVTSANIDATTATLRIQDVQISGNLTVSGTLTSIDTVNLNVTDPLIKLANNNTAADTIDTGFYTLQGNATQTWYSGLFRDSSASGLEEPIFKLFSANVEPTTTVATGDASYRTGYLYAYLKAGFGSGTFEANATGTTITANSTWAVSITANTLSLSTALPGTSGGTGLNTTTNNAILVGNSTNGFNQLSLGTSGYVLQSNGTALVYDILDGGTF